MADIKLTITIPDAKIPKVAEAFTGMAGKNISISPNVHPAGGSAGWSYSYIPQQGGEGTKAFGERVVFETMRALVRAYFQNKDTSRYAGDVDAVSKPANGVEDDIITPG